MKIFILFLIVISLVIPVSIYAIEDGCITNLRTTDSEIIITCDESFSDLLNRITTLESESQSMQSEIDYLKTLTIPDYSKLAEVIEFEGEYIQEQHRQITRADFTIQGYHNDGDLDVRCMLGYETGNDSISTNIKLGLNEYSIECTWSTSNTGEIDIVFTGDIEPITYTIPLEN